MSADAAFLEEIASFLNTNEPPATNSAGAEVSSDPDEQSQSITARVSALELQSSDDGATRVPRTRSRADPSDKKRLTRRQKEAQRKKRYQWRLKNERETLQSMAKELASRLARLQEENELKKQRCDTNLARAHSVWRDLALVQRDHLRRSKEDQTNLVAAVSNQAAYLSILRGLFPASDSITMKHETSFSIASSLQVNMQANRVLFGEHLRQVIAAHDQVDDVFREYDVLAMPDGMACSMRTPYTTGGTEYFQHFNKFSQPFSVKQTQQAWWRLASLSGVIENRENYDDIADPNDTVILRVRLVRKLVTGAEISIIQRYICRRVVEENRALLTWKTFSEGEGIFAGMQLEETGWACLQPSMDGDSTVIGVCVRQSPMRFGNLRVQQTENQEFCDFMHNLVKENAQLMTNLISKTLMDDTLADIDI